MQDAVVTGKRKKTLEEIYQVPSEIDHILLRPDRDAGSLVPNASYQYVVIDDEPNSDCEEEEDSEKKEEKKDVKPKEEKQENVPNLIGQTAPLPSQPSATTTTTPATTSMTTTTTTPTTAIVATAQKKVAVKGRLRWITFSSALYKTFDEVLANAADNRERSQDTTCIKVDWDEKTGVIRIWNNGPCIPIEIHKEKKMYIPEVVLGNLRGGSNFDDEENRSTIGRNGLGAKLTNIFSTMFQVETVCAAEGKRYQQTWTQNMKQVGAPIITTYAKNKRKQNGIVEDYTQITYHPDYSRFVDSKQKLATTTTTTTPSETAPPPIVSGLTRDILQLFTHRVYQLAATCKGVQVFLNGKEVVTNNWKKYCNLFLKRKEDKVYVKVNERLQVCVAPNRDGHGVEHITCVNNAYTVLGGTHLNTIVDQIVKVITDEVKTRTKGDIVLKRKTITDHLLVFITMTVDNPSFNEQLKLTLNTKPAVFGTDCTLPSTFLKELTQHTELMNRVMQIAARTESKMLSKSDGKKSKTIDIDEESRKKLEDAGWAGTKHSDQCTIIFVEGDSAKALAMAGLAAIPDGRKRYGVFALTGKFINVRGQDPKTISSNKVFHNIKQILGLKNGVEYPDTSKLRYGHIMIMTDQDHDGAHIKMLMVNLLDSYWPGLLDLPGFLYEFRTPLIKVSRKSTVLSFYTIPEYEQWKAAHEHETGWVTKYYKGLGTSTSKEGREYFQNMKEHKIALQCMSKHDHDVIDIAFNKERVDDRRAWLSKHVPGTYLRYGNRKVIPISEYIEQELVLYGIAHNERSLPSMVDGRCTGSRKVLKACFHRPNKEIKVAALAGLVTDKVAYHHAQKALEDTIVGMAQNYPTSQNINLLVPSGQFGTRDMGGKDSASSRYINTYLAKYTRSIFKMEDDTLLTYLVDDNQTVEPSWFLPVVCMVLVNGVDGNIGWAYSSTIPPHNPRDIIANQKRKLRGEPMQEMLPWYRDWTGTVTPTTVVKAAPKKKKVGVVVKPEFLPSLTPTPPSSSSSSSSSPSLPVETKPCRYQVSGKLSLLSGDETSDVREYVITELPPHESVEGYKEKVLDKMVKQGVISDLDKTESTETTIRLKFRMKREVAEQKEALPGGLLKYFKLHQMVNTTNMVLFTPQGTIKQYSSVMQILNEWCEFRFPFYEKRKQHLVADVEKRWKRAYNRARLIRLANVRDGDSGQQLNLKGVPKQQLVKTLWTLKFDLLQKEKRRSASDDAETNMADVEEEEKDIALPPVVATNAIPSDSVLMAGYEYLLSMPLWSLTMEHLAKLQAEEARLLTDLDILRHTTPQDMWMTDMDNLLLQMDEDDRARWNDQKETLPTKKKVSSSSSSSSRKRKPAVPKPTARKPKSAKLSSSS